MKLLRKSKSNSDLEPKFSINFKHHSIKKYQKFYEKPIQILRFMYEKTSSMLEALQAQMSTTSEEMSFLSSTRSNFTCSQIRYETKINQADLKIYNSLIEDNSTTLNFPLLSSVNKNSYLNKQSLPSSLFSND